MIFVLYNYCIKIYGMNIIETEIIKRKLRINEKKKERERRRQIRERIEIIKEN